MVFMGERGIRYPVNDTLKIEDYISKMLGDGRILVIEDDGLHTVLFFSVCYKFGEFFLKDTWDYMEHCPEGDMIYIEKIVSKNFNKEIRKLIEAKLTELYPKFKIGIWHRWGKVGDRQVIARRSYAKNQCVK